MRIILTVVSSFCCLLYTEYLNKVRFDADENAVIYGYPSSEQSETYCYSFRVTTLLGVILFIHMHLECILCYRLASYYAVSKKDSLVHDTSNSILESHADQDNSFLFPRTGTNTSDRDHRTNVL